MEVKAAYWLLGVGSLTILWTYFKSMDVVCCLQQVKSGSIFDNVLVTDDEKYAEDVGEKTWGASKDGEKKMKEDHDEEERKQREEEDKKRKEGQYIFSANFSIPFPR